MTEILHFELEYLRPVGQSWSNFICSITGGGERLHNVLRQIGSKLWCPWQQKAPLTYNEENGVSTFSRLLLIRSFLAHLSQRLTRWAYSIPMVPRPSIVHTFKLEYLWCQLTNLDQILCVASLGWGKGCLRFRCRLDQNSGFHGNRKPLLTYNGENDVATFSQLFLIRSFSYLQVTRTCIKSRTRSNFGQIGPLQS